MKTKRYSFVRFYKGNRYMGAGYVPECSNSSQRRLVALKGGITYYNRIHFVRGKNNTGNIVDFRKNKSFHDFKHKQK